jgi:hypothetical protein
MTKRWPCIVVAILCCLLLFPAPASALCVPLMAYPQPDINSPAKFMEAMIDSLVYLKIATTSAKDGASTVEVLIGLAARKEAYKCGSDLLSRFTSSTNPFVARISKTGSEIYTTLVQLTERSELSIKNFVNNPEKQGDFLSALAKNRHDRDEIELLLVSQSAQSTYALVQFGPGGEGTGSLNITASQRASLMKSVVEKLGPGVRQPPVDKDGTVDVCDGAGHMIYSFLAKKEWRSKPG